MKLKSSKAQSTKLRMSLLPKLLLEQHGFFFPLESRNSISEIFLII